MVEIAEAKRSRGRPQVRSDGDTRSVITDAASKKFQEMGYAAACVSDIAQDAGVSTKTLYRLFPAKSDLFESVAIDRIGRFTLEVDTASGNLEDVRRSLENLLEAYGRLTLVAETIALNRLAISEADRFPELATAFYNRAILGTAKVIERWLRARSERGDIVVEDIPMAAGILRGMMTLEPQRAAMLGQREPLSPEEIRERSTVCAKIFLNGCLPKQQNFSGRNSAGSAMDVRCG